MLVNEQRKKLSKRRDPVAVESYRDQGYLPEAFVNYLALLGWSPRATPRRSPLDELVEQFRLEDVHHAPAFFDVAKLTHMNGEYIRALTPEAFIEAPRPLGCEPGTAAAARPPGRPSGSTRRCSPHGPAGPRAGRHVGEVPAMVDFLFLADPAG